ncbi:inner membrane protein YnjI [Escherichia coli DEC3A]|nr:inner membrane protein YnjI [Escherichia coli DEC3A]EHV08494.1 inner membrane protein YnjI [Escherichia coli DEC4D]
MKKVLLQNHPGSEKYSFNGWEIFNSNFERMIKENKTMLLCKWGFYLTCVVAVMFVFAAITSNGLNERGLITAGCSFLYLLIMMGLIVRAGFKAKKNSCIIIRLKVLSRSVSRNYRRYN